MPADSNERLRFSPHPRFRTLGILAVVLVSAVSIGLYVYFQAATREEIRTAVFERHKDAQIEATSRMAGHIGTDLNLIVNTVEGLANSYYLQRSDFSSQNAKALIKEKYDELSPKVSSLLILDSDNIVAVSHAPPLAETFLSADFSQRQWVVETRASGKPLYSDGFERQGIYRIFISYPVISKETQEFLGIIAVSIPTVPYFAYYANVHDVNSQFLVALNGAGTLLAVGASQDLVGDNFFGEETQNFINRNQVLSDLTRDLLAGNSGFALYDYGSGERFTTQFPVEVRGEPLYFIQLVTPTEGIYSEVDSSLQEENVRMFMLLTGSIISIGILTVFLFKWNGSLVNEVKERTRQLADANERLELNLKAQKEFLEVAAHEIRTPVQPILGLAQALQADASGATVAAGAAITATQERQLLDAIIRNAQRLKRLTENLLDVSRIDSRSLRLKKQPVDLTGLIADAMQDFRNALGPDSKVELILNPSDSPILTVDEERVNQVVSNLLHNSLKFVQEGTVEVDVIKNQHEVVVTVKDSGEGIHPDVLPKLFVKFVSRSDSGTGLGLYIAKGIVEAHGGRIWAENNADGKGASFHFTLPIN